MIVFYTKETVEKMIKEDDNLYKHKEYLKNILNNRINPAVKLIKNILTSNARLEMMKFNLNSINKDLLVSYHSGLTKIQNQYKNHILAIDFIEHFRKTKKSLVQKENKLNLLLKYNFVYSEVKTEIEKDLRKLGIEQEVTNDMVKKYLLK